MRGGLFILAWGLLVLTLAVAFAPSPDYKLYPGETEASYTPNWY